MQSTSIKVNLAQAASSKLYLNPATLRRIIHRLLPYGAIAK